VTDSEKLNVPMTDAPPVDATKGEPVRAAVRFPLHLELVLFANQREYHAVTEDVSASGVLFVSDELPPLHSPVEFRLTMPASVMGGADDVVLHCTGRIVRHAASDGRRLAAAVIDEYVLKAEQV
jgi:hypothetical protein